jgi:hypothetical protein
MPTDPLTRILVLFCTLFLCTRTWGQQSQTFVWSSKCADCESTIFTPGWYTDGSGIFAEAINGNVIGVAAGVSAIDRYFVVALGFSGVEGHGAVSLNPTTAVTIESDSSPHMVLYSLEHPDNRILKGSAAEKKQLKNKIVSVGTGAITAGYLLFPTDNAASRLTVVVVVGSETFRFPFVRSPNAHAKFGNPDSTPAPAFAQQTPVPTDHIRSSSPAQTAPSPGATASFQSPPAAAATGTVSSTAADCDKNISFAVAESGQIVSRVPAFAQKWISSNQKHYRGLCFSQIPDPRADNYVLVFAVSRSAFNGLYPTVRTNTTTSTTPVSGTGTVTDNNGGMWNYTYDGSTTTTTTTTTHENLPYTDTSNTLYLYSYDHQGKLMSERWRTITTRQGGDGTNTLGYNLGAAVGAIHFKEHLLKSAVGDVVKAPR